MCKNIKNHVLVTINLSYITNNFDKKIIFIINYLVIFIGRALLFGANQFGLRDNKFT